MAEPLKVARTSYAVVDFLEWQRQGTLNLSPFYQRRPVWNPRVKSLLMDSLVRGFPIPLIFLHNQLDMRTSKTVRQVVDGQQRLRTILSFIDPDCIADPDEWDDFRILRSHNRDYGNLAFAELPDDVQSNLLQTPLSVNVLPADIADVTVLQIFQRMNSTGIKLNPQEIRNGSYFGEFKDASYALAYEQSQRWIKWGLFDRQQVAQMREVEFVSDLLGLILRGVAARSDSYINSLYREFDERFDDRGVAEDKFRAAFDTLAPLYDGRTRHEMPARFRSTAWFYALFAVVLDVADSDESDEEGSGLPSTGALNRALSAEQLADSLREVDNALTSRGRLADDIAESLRRQTTHRRGRLDRIRLVRMVMNGD